MRKTRVCVNTGEESLKWETEPLQEMSLRAVLGAGHRSPRTPAAPLARHFLSWDGEANLTKPLTPRAFLFLANK